MDEAAPSTTRRGLLAGVGVGVSSALAGCWERIWSQAETPSPDQIGLTIKTVPADDDRFAASIASELRENYRAAGIAASHEPVREADLYRDVLLEGEYDVFVARHQGFDDYDCLRGLLHSQFVAERGWQNPFHFSDVVADEHLEEQRAAAEDDRPDVVVDLINYLLETTPFTAVAFPETVDGVSDRLDVSNPPRRSHDYVEIVSHPDNGPRDGPLEVGVYGEGITERLNPIIVDRNRIDGLLDLLYDPLARPIDGEYVPWLAADVEWTDDTRPRARITLREGLEWHDGESLDAQDVAFTLRLLEDTSLGEVEGGVPAQRYRGRRTLVDDVNVIDSGTITLSFSDTTRTVARRVLSIPVLPEHVWADRSEVVAEHQTRAITVDNDEPVGSGLFTYSDSEGDSEIELEPFDDHALREASDRPSVLENFSRFEGIRFQISPNPGAMVDALVDGEVDLTASGLPPEYASTVRETEGVSTVTGTSAAFYMIGYNVHHRELGNPRFRQICSRLIDREHVVSTIFDHPARAASTAHELFGIHGDWTYDDREFDDEQVADFLDFPGTDGEVNSARARSLFEDVGYRYEDEALIE